MTQFALTDDQLAIRDMAQAFAAEHFAPKAVEWDETKHFPVDVMREAASLGIGGIYIKDDVGGSAMTRFDAARDFAAKVNVGMVGINVPIPVPIAYYTFGGWKKSGFGDLNQHGPDSIRFYTKTKTVTARWPYGVKEGAEFSIPTMN